MVTLVHLAAALGRLLVTHKRAEVDLEASARYYADWGW